MSHHRHIVSMAAVSLLASAGMAVAETSKLSLDPAVMLDEAPAQRTLLMSGLDKIGAGKTLDDLGITITGYVQAGYLYNPNHSSGEINESQAGMSLENRGNHFMFNQIDVAFERLVDVKKWDIGGRIEWIYGTDGRYIHSNGMEIYSDESDQDYQFDPFQVYVDVAVPVGNGLMIRVGKFEALLGYESQSPVGNAFYTHSMISNYLQPGTFTGVVGYYDINDQWSIAGGVVRGWDDSLEDKNDNGVTGVLQLGWSPSEKWSNTFNVTYGPEGDSHDDETMNGKNMLALDYVLEYQLTERTTLALNATYLANNGDDFTHDFSSSYGFAGYANYIINDYLTANGRVEWMSYQPGASFLDHTGLGAPRAENTWGLSLGVTIRPMPKDPIGSNLMIRPEVTYYYGEHKIFGGMDDADSNNEVLIGGDIVFTF